MLRAIRNILIFIVMVATVNSGAMAAPKKKSKSIPCPKYIADKTTGVVHKSVGGPYKCFDKIKKAKKKGFASISQLQQQDFTGWWRTRLSSVTDTCDDIPDFSGPVLFVQISQNNGASFTEFCPTSGRMDGHRTDNGLLTARKDIINVTQSANHLGCTGGQVERSQHFSLTKIVTGAAAYAAEYAIVWHCPLPEEADRSCTTKYTGIAFFETHPIWPPVDPNLSNFSAGCDAALVKCSDCHQGISFVPGTSMLTLK